MRRAAKPSTDLDPIAVHHPSIPPNILSVVVSLGSCGRFLGWREWSAEVPLHCAERVRRLLDVGNGGFESGEWGVRSGE